ncbi:flagellar basal body rod protein FlgB [Clostridium sp. BJN0001]|uniref:flagellar basal body rod protein FlgB n=1 Tax=Clostridium sp. BJN0001 TaxID=2930219 RepID=UPI001FD084D9|nr:flagellar basal body rod protein FlgB [Clostridium sp. BJN0001]
MSIPMVSDNTYNLIKRGMDASNVRANAISNNIANINTKNYKRFNVIFEQNLEKQNDSDFKLKTTNENHYKNEASGLSLKRTENAHFTSNGEENGGISVTRDTSTSMRTDGNNVDLEVEKANQAANTLKYYALVAAANNKFTNLKTVLK